MRSTRRHPPMVAVLFALIGGGLVIGTAGPAEAATTRERIVQIATAERDNDSRNREKGGDECNFYTGAVRFKTSSCPDGYGKSEWCADFVNFVWSTAGNIDDMDRIDGFADSVRQYGRANGTWYHRDSDYRPQPGDAFVEIDRNGNGRADHTGLVVANDGDTLTTIEGNSGGGYRVAQNTRSRNSSQVWGFIAPVLKDGATPPPPPPFGRAGSAGVLFAGDFQTFFRRADNHVLHHMYDPGDEVWINRDLGGSVVSAPSTIVHRDDLWVFARGSDNQLTYRVHSGSAWGNWLWMPGQISGAPALGALSERLFVIAREGTALKYRFYDVDTGWNASNSWLGIGQPSASVNVVTDPVVAILDDRLAVVVRGSDNNMWLRWVRGASASAAPIWSGWTKLTGAAAGNPAAAAAGNELHVFVRTPAGEMRYHSYVDGAPSWTVYRGLGNAPDGTFAGSPAAIGFSGLLTVYSRNDAGQMLYRTLRGTTWSAWLQLGRPGTVNLDSSPNVMRYGPSRVMAARGTDAQLYYRAYSDTSLWSPWIKLPGTHAAMP